MRLAHLNNAVLRATARRLRPWGLSVMEFDIIAHIGGTPGITQQDLSERLLVTEGNVTYQLAKLEGRGLLKRRSDGRCKRLHLAERGQKLFDDLVPQQEDWHVERFAVLTLEEQEQLLRLLRKLEHAQR